MCNAGRKQFVEINCIIKLSCHFCNTIRRTVNK